MCQMMEAAIVKTRAGAGKASVKYGSSGDPFAHRIAYAFVVYGEDSELPHGAGTETYLVEPFVHLLDLLLIGGIPYELAEDRVRIFPGPYEELRTRIPLDVPSGPIEPYTADRYYVLLGYGQSTAHYSMRHPVLRYRGHDFVSIRAPDEVYQNGC